jgi:hypothetical protein
MFSYFHPSVVGRRPPDSAGKLSRRGIFTQRRRGAEARRTVLCEVGALSPAAALEAELGEVRDRVRAVGDLLA